MTEGMPLDPVRVALIRDRLAGLLMEQPGAFETYDTGCQLMTPAFWWKSDEQWVHTPAVLAWLARNFWPSQPLSRIVGEFYATCIAAAEVAERPRVRDLWHEHTEHAQRFLAFTKTSPEVLPIIRSAFDDKHHEVASLLEDAAAIVRRASRLSVDREQGRLEQILVSGARRMATGSAPRPAQNLDAVMAVLTGWADNLWDETDDGLPLPRSRGPWKMFETRVAGTLLELGVPATRVTAIFSVPDRDPEDERARIARNARRTESP